MPVHLTNLSADRKPLAVPVGAETLQVVYRPQAVSAADVLLFGRDGDEHNLLRLQQMVSLLARLIAEWDLVGEKDKPIAPTEDNLRNLPTLFLGELFRAIMADMNPGEAGASSAAGSSPAA
jgi:hypothetical protein